MLSAADLIEAVPARPGLVARFYKVPKDGKNTFKLDHFIRCRKIAQLLIAYRVAADLSQTRPNEYARNAQLRQSHLVQIAVEMGLAEGRDITGAKVEFDTHPSPGAVHLEIEWRERILALSDEQLYNWIDVYTEIIQSFHDGAEWDYFVDLSHYMFLFVRLNGAKTVVEHRFVSIDVSSLVWAWYGKEEFPRQLSMVLHAATAKWILARHPRIEMFEVDPLRSMYAIFYKAGFVKDPPTDAPVYFLKFNRQEYERLALL